MVRLELGVELQDAITSVAIPKRLQDRGDGDAQAAGPGPTCHVGWIVGVDLEVHGLLDHSDGEVDIDALLFLPGTTGNGQVRCIDQGIHGLKSSVELRCIHRAAAPRVVIGGWRSGG